MDRFPDGVWPVMLTPFNNKNKIDYPALERLVNFYIDAGVSGLFAVCQSSELFFLSFDERRELSAAVVKYAAGKLPVISGGQSASDLETQVREVESISSTNPEAVVLLTNQFAAEVESDEIWWDNMSRFLQRIDPSVTLGLYECPVPYKRVLLPSLLKKCVGTGRFALMKDTCCDAALIRDKLKATEEAGFKLFNANTATLLDSLRDGARGYSGVMANFHPELYVWLCRNFLKYPTESEYLTTMLTMCSYIEKQYYPVNAKYALSLKGIMDVYTRTKPASGMTETFCSEVRQLMKLSKAAEEALRKLN